MSEERGDAPLCVIVSRRAVRLCQDNIYIFSLACGYIWLKLAADFFSTSKNNYLFFILLYYSFLAPMLICIEMITFNANF